MQTLPIFQMYYLNNAGHLYLTLLLELQLQKDKGWWVGPSQALCHPNTLFMAFAWHSFSQKLCWARCSEVRKARCLFHRS